MPNNMQEKTKKVITTKIVQREKQQEKEDQWFLLWRIRKNRGKCIGKVGLPKCNYGRD